MVTDAHVFWIHRTQNMHPVLTQYSHPFKVPTRVQKDEVVYNKDLSIMCKLWDEPFPSCVITINNANNTQSKRAYHSPQLSSKCSSFSFQRTNCSSNESCPGFSTQALRNIIAIAAIIPTPQLKASSCSGRPPIYSTRDAGKLWVPSMFPLKPSP